MKINNVSSLAYLFICIILIMLWGYHGMIKLIGRYNFYIQISRHPLLHDNAFMISWCVPLLELMIALCIALPVFRVAGLYTSAGLLFIFTTYITYLFIADSQLPCACSGLIEGLSWSAHLLINIVLLTLSLVCACRHRKNSHGNNIHNSHTK